MKIVFRCVTVNESKQREEKTIDNICLIFSHCANKFQRKLELMPEKCLRVEGKSDLFGNKMMVFSFRNEMGTNLFSLSLCTRVHTPLGRKGFSTMLLFDPHFTHSYYIVCNHSLRSNSSIVLCRCAVAAMPSSSSMPLPLLLLYLHVLYFVTTKATSYHTYIERKNTKRKQI